MKVVGGRCRSKCRKGRELATKLEGNHAHGNEAAGCGGIVRIYRAIMMKSIASRIERLSSARAFLPRLSSYTADASAPSALRNQL